MSYSAQQITEPGRQPRHGKPPKKLEKKKQHRRMRAKMKDLNFVPHYGKYEAGWVD